MNILTKVQEIVKRLEAAEAAEGKVINKEQLELFVTGYLQGIYDKQNEEMNLTKKDAEKVKEWVNNYFIKPFYFTFGSYEGYPFQDGYIIVKAETIREAAEKFMQAYPNERNEDVLNCSDYYSPEAWERILERGHYVDQEPLAIME